MTRRTLKELKNSRELLIDSVLATEIWATKIYSSTACLKIDKGKLQEASASFDKAEAAYMEARKLLSPGAAQQAQGDLVTIRDALNVVGAKLDIFRKSQADA